MKNNAPTLFTFIDLFAGIGGFRLAFEPVAGQCVFASEWDKFSQQTYEANFGHKPAGDITQIRSEDIPDHDVTKHNALGNSHGFQHPTQGTENVKNLTAHNKGQTFEIIKWTLEDELNYHIFYNILDARFVVPQHRERIFIVGFKDTLDFKFPTLPNLNPKIRDILEDEFRRHLSHS